MRKAATDLAINIWTPALLVILSSAVFVLIVDGIGLSGPVRDGLVAGTITAIGMGVGALFAE